MPLIKILPENLANKIAAGEVVQRPESVLKELLENALDSGAENIIVYIKRAGKNLIQVIDDGIGMDEQDAVLCFQRHATSKIYKNEDIENIVTYGFRGEALSSIAAVSKMQIKTKTVDEELGTLVTISGEGQVETEKIASSKGTSISVKNLFYNTPARRNFLKTDSTEMKHMVETFRRISLINHDIGFKFYSEGDLFFDFRPESAEERIISVIGKEAAESLIKVKEKTDFFRFSGYISPASDCRKARGEQYLYINNRFVTSRLIHHAIISAFEGMIEKGDFPFYILSLEIEPRKIDVNVHPQKLEVKFEYEKDIYAIIFSVIKKAVAKNTRNLGLAEKSNAETLEAVNREIRKTSVFSDEEVDLLFSSINRDLKQSNTDLLSREIFNEIPAETNRVSSKSEENVPFIVYYHNKYILSQIKSGMLIIDSVRAQERITYDKAIKQFEAGTSFSQQLLFPEKVEFTEAEAEIVDWLNPKLGLLGFDLRKNSRRSYELCGVAPEVRNGFEVRVLMNIISEMRDFQNQTSDVSEQLVKVFSEQAVIKHERLSENEMREIIDQLFATSNPYFTPGGMPVILKMQLSEMDEKFAVQDNSMSEFKIENY